MSIRSPLALALVCAVLTGWEVLPQAHAAEAKPPEQLAHFDAMGKPVVFPDGTVALYFIDIRGPGLGKTPEVQELRVRTSQDNGKTWSDFESLTELPAEEGGFGFHDSLVDQNGEVHIFMLCDANTGVIRAREAAEGRPAVEPLARQRLDIWHLHSTDGRTKWAKPHRIWEGRGGDLQSVIQLRSGRLVLPICYLVKRSWREKGKGLAAFTYMGQFDTSVLYSDDSGKTWKQSDAVLRVQVPYIAANGGVEPVVVQLNDDRVWMLLRTQNGRFFESFSADGAEWSPLEPTGILSCDAPAGLVPLPDKRLVMLWNNCLRFPYAQGSRWVLHAAISSDDGKTWRGYREILRDPHRKQPPPPGGDHGVAYPYPRLMKDGRIIYTMWVESGEGRSVQAFDPEWLLQTEDSDDFANGLDRWSVFGTKGVEITEHQGSADGKVLAVHRVDNEWPATAVWNFPAGASGSIKLRLLAEPQFGGARLLLTDHFSVPFDLEDRFHSVYSIPITTDARQSLGVTISPEKWIDLELRWDGGRRQCEVLIDGKPSGSLPQQRVSPGPSYLRIRSSATTPQKGRLLVDSVQVKVAGSERGTGLSQSN